MKRENRLRQILSEGKVAVGTCVDSYSPAAIEVVGYSGLDWVRVCNEYSWRRDESMEHMMRAAALVGITAMIRVEKGDPYLISKAFQCGAGAILVSDIANYEEALAVVKGGQISPQRAPRLQRFFLCRPLGRGQRERLGRMVRPGTHGRGHDRKRAGRQPGRKNHGH